MEKQNTRLDVLKLSDNVLLQNNAITDSIEWLFIEVGLNLSIIFTAILISYSKHITAHNRHPFHACVHSVSVSGQALTGLHLD
jgi:hypothetical protein